MGQKSSTQEQLSCYTIVGRVCRTLELGHAGAIVRCVCSPDDKTAASCSTDHTISLWDIASGQLIRTLDGHRADVTTCAFGNDLLATGSHDGEVLLWRYRDGKRLSKIALHGCPINCCVISPNDRLLALASDDGRARVYTIRQDAGEFIQGAQYKELVGHDGAVNDICFSPDNRHVITCSSDATIRTWDSASGDGRLCIDSRLGKVLCCRYSPSGDQIVTMNRQAVTIWCARSGREVFNVQDGYGRGYHCLAVHPRDPVAVVACMDGSLIIQPINRSDCRAIRRSNHKGPLLSCSFSPRGGLGLTGGIDGKIFVWV